MPGITGFLIACLVGVNCRVQNDPKAIRFWVLNTQSNMEITWC